MIEYKVRPVGRYIVTRYEAEGGGPVGSVGSRIMGEFQNHEGASRVAIALATSEPGATATTNILPHNAPASELLRNIAEEFGGDTENGLVVLVDRSGETHVFGLSPSDYPGAGPHDLLGMAKAKLAELGVK